MRAPFETCMMTGDFVSTAAWMMACICSIVLKLNAGIAYPPLTAFANIFLVLTRPSFL